MSEFEQADAGYHRYHEQETTFNDILADWLHRAPYLFASLGIHALLALVVAGLGFLRPTTSEAPTLEVVTTPPPPDVIDKEEPPEEPIEEVVEEPVLQEAELEEVVEMETLEDTGDPDFTADAPFDAESWNNAVGLGGGAGGKLGGRGGRGGGRRKGSPTEKAVSDALKWLADHQQPDDGYWDSDEFMYYDQYPNEPQSDGAGNPVVDVGLTGLASLAFMGNDNTMTRGPFADNVKKGITWLRENQLANGLFGDEVGNPTLYNHSIATMAMGEAYYFSGKSPLLKKNVQKAVQVIVNARNPYQAWRYTLEPNGDNDSSITGWMVFALKTAQESGIDVSKDVYEGSENWFATMTDPGNGRTGYAFGEGGGPGSRPSRPRAYLEKFPPEKSEALTAVALLSRIFMTDHDQVRTWKAHPQWETMKKQAELCMNVLPQWDPEGGTCDMYYWYYATFAMYQIGDTYWKTWQKAIEGALLPSQRQDGNFKGSWDPAGPWGHEGGRVYSTAIGAIILEVYYRYSKVLGAR
ncbi:MAG TPA: prenyltransferase/squalene oxidase repeat-containing protein [Planctomycetota bacterium]